MAETEESRRPPQQLWAHGPPWPPRPAPPKRRRSNLFLTVVGLAIGAAVVVIVPAVLLALLILGRWLTAPPVPDGEPLRLAKTELVGTWQDEDGGRLVVAGDATFSAVDVCGDYSDGATGAQSGFDLASTMSGKGSWEAGTSGGPDENATEITLDFAGGDVSGWLTARGTADAPVLWTYVGDPDEGHLCVLHRDGPAS